MTAAHASKRTFVTVEVISETNLFDDESLAAGVIPALYIEGVVEAKRGAAPLGLWGAYEADESFLRDYVRAAKTQEGFDAFVANWLERPSLAAE
jgi:glutaconate CoA-transferase subunit A